MQIRRQPYRDKKGNVKLSSTFQILRSVYDPVSKRSRQVMLGSVDGHSCELSESLVKVLTAEEIGEFRIWREKHMALMERELMTVCVSNALAAMGAIAQAAEQGLLESQDLHLLKEAVERVGAALTTSQARDIGSQ